MLRACPFCGGKPQRFDVDADCYICCTECNCQTRLFIDPEEAILAWNNRYLQQSLLDDRRRLLSEITNLKERIVELNKTIEEHNKNQFCLEDFIK